jgi:hypothetical protein
MLHIALELTRVVIPRTFDQFLYAFDGSLGVQPSFMLGRLLYNPNVANLVKTYYAAIALPVALLYGMQKQRGYALGYNILTLVIAASIGGYLLYFVLPAIGPAYEFAGRFPFVIRPVLLRVGEVLPIRERIFRNAMPSVHFVTALMLCWNCRILPTAARAFFWLSMAATAFVILALGEHYFIDLVVAFPLALAFHATGITAIPLGSRERWGSPLLWDLAPRLRDWDSFVMA